MARTKKGTQEKKLWTKAKWKGFVSVTLNQQEKKAVKDMNWSAEDALQFLQDAATAGYKVSLSYSIPEDVYTVSLTGQYMEKANPGVTISQRHRNLDIATRAVCWMAQEDGYQVDWESRWGEVGDDNW
jgi:hypothetical protein